MDKPYSRAGFQQRVNFTYHLLLKMSKKEKILERHYIGITLLSQTIEALQIFPSIITTLSVPSDSQRRASPNQGSLAERKKSTRRNFHLRSTQSFLNLSASKTP